MAEGADLNLHSRYAHDVIVDEKFKKDLNLDNMTQTGFINDQVKIYDYAPKLSAFDGLLQNNLHKRWSYFPVVKNFDQQRHFLLESHQSSERNQIDVDKVGSIDCSNKSPEVESHLKEQKRVLLKLCELKQSLVEDREHIRLRMQNFMQG